jgi:putative transposase
MKRFEIQPGNEIRGMMIRLYPDNETELKLLALESDARRVWNWLVKQTEEVLEVRQGYAVKNNLVDPKPTAPDYTGMTPEVAKETKEKYVQNCKDWHAAVHKATDKLPECAYRSFKDMQSHFRCKYDYQLLQKVDGWYHENDSTERLIVGGSTFYQALTKNYFTRGKNQRRKKFRRVYDSMPLQVKSGDCFKLGDFGTRRGNTFYNCRVSFNGLKIKGRLPGKSPEGRWLEGVSITRKADGWWASIKIEVPIYKSPEAIPGTVVGIDVGLDNIAAISNGTIISNKRGKEYVERIAGRQTLAAERRNNNLPIDRMENTTHRLQLSATRHLKHQIYNEIIKPLSQVETIKLEELNAKIGQMGSAKVSVMRLIRSLLLERYGARDNKNQPVPGNRVREVEPHYTSQDCSQCGFRSKESWSYDHGRIGECPQCKYRADRDLNAARNIAAKPPIPLNV